MIEERPKILYLDDEENNLMAFNAMFRREYDVFTTTSAAEAMAYMNHNEVQIILSDQKMPDISGVEFFEMTVPDFPDAVRILVTGYADIEAVIDAINKGQVYRYVTKPWDENDLRMAVKNAIDKWRGKRELRLKNQVLERALSELEKFVYSASHDLRAPVVSIKGVLQLAKSDQSFSGGGEYFDMIERSTNKLDGFLQNLIHYYQNLKSDQLNSVVDFNTLVEGLIEKFTSPEISSALKVSGEVKFEGTFITDEHRLSMAMGKVIINAIRFKDTNKKEQLVSIKVDQNSQKATIKIEDNGIGIEESQLPLIFDMFHRNSERSEGNGLGLYIAKEAITKLGGSIAVSSELNGGTIVTIQIPNGK